MLGHVPAGLCAGVREEGAGTEEIFFRAEGIDLIFDFVCFAGDGQYPQAVNGRGNRAEAGKAEAQLIPGEIAEVDHKK